MIPTLSPERQLLCPATLATQSAQILWICTERTTPAGVENVCAQNPLPTQFPECNSNSYVKLRIYKDIPVIALQVANWHCQRQILIVGPMESKINLFRNAAAL
jgi:hypothetical protein